MSLEDLLSEMENNKNDPNNSSALRGISIDGVASYDISVYEKELDENPTLEKYNELFLKINDWETKTSTKNAARTKLMQYWDNLQI